MEARSSNFASANCSTQSNREISWWYYQDDQVRGRCWVRTSNRAMAARVPEAKSHVKDATSMSGPDIMALTSTQGIQRSNGRRNRGRHGEESNKKRRGERAKACDAAGVKKEKGKPRGSYSKSAKDFRQLKATQQQQQQSWVGKRVMLQGILVWRRPTGKASEHGCSDYPYRAPAWP